MQTGVLQSHPSLKLSRKFPAGEKKVVRMVRPVRRSFGWSCTVAGMVSLMMLSGCHRDPNVRKQKYYESGMRYEKKGEFREAAIQFQNALRFDKNYAAAHYELAKTYTSLNMPLQAYPELQRTVDLQPNNLQARIDLGNLLVLGRQPGQAAEQANAVLAQQPNNADAYALLSKVAQAQGKQADAITQIQHALAIDPNRSEFNAQLGFLESVGPTPAPQAMEHLQKAVSQDGANVNARIALAAILQRKGDTHGAEEQLKGAVSAAPHNLQARATLASFYLSTNNRDAAEATIRKATEDFNDDPDGAAMLSRYYQLNNQLDKDEAAYASLAQTYPKSTPIKVNYAQILMTRGEYDKADGIVKDLTKADANNPQVAVLNASTLMHQGKNDEAFNLLQTAAKNNPDNADVHTLLGFAAAQKGNLDLAEKSYREAVQRDPRNLNAERGLAEIANSKGDKAQLRDIATHTMQYFPMLPEPYIWRGTAEANDKQYDQAAADFQQALKLNPKQATALAELGQVRLRQGKIAEGKAMLEQAVENDPSSEALNVLVAMDLQAKQPAAAINRIQQQISRGKPNAGLYDELSTAQMLTHDLNGAMDSSKKAMDLDPNDLIARRNFTQAAMAQGQIAPAMNMWEGYVASHPRDPQGPTMLGLLYEAAGDSGNAIKSYQKSLSLNPNQPPVENNLAFLMVEANANLDVALSLAQQAHAGMPDSPDTTDTLAWVYYKKGIYGSALDLLQQAAKAAPDNPSIQYHLGMTLSRMNNKPEAVTHLKRATQLGPDSAAGKSAAQELGHLS